MDTPADKRRRITRACDQCRQKKVKCEGETGSGRGCSACRVIGLNCTWDDVKKKRGRRQKNVEALEARVQHLEAALNTRADVKTAITTFSPLFPQSSAGSPSIQNTSNGYSPSSGSDVDDNVDTKLELLNERVRGMDLNALHWTGGLGVSSGQQIGGKVDRLKDEHGLASPDPPGDRHYVDFWEAEVTDRIRTWQTQTRFQFPEPQLLFRLVDAFLTTLNHMYPLFHRPTLYRQIEEGLHYRDPSFGSVVLLICAIGARTVTDDPRVYPPGGSMRSAGWNWFTQVNIAHRDLFHPPRLHDCQTYLLAAMYGGATFRSNLSWVLVGIAVRKIHQVGAHLKQVYSAIPNVQDELWKRCFWIAFCMDVTMSSETGRPCSISDSDFSVGLPIDCDDEFWEDPDPTMAFKQPEGRPSSISGFIHILQLRRIQLRAMRSLLSAGVSFKTGPTDETVAAFDSELNHWHECLPEHLRWSTYRHTVERSNEGLGRLAVHVFVEYNNLLIIIHRPLVAVETPTPASIAAHAICTTAARAAARAFEHCTFVPQFLPSANSSAMILLLTLLGAKRMNVRVDKDAVLSDIQRCITALRSAAPIYQVAEHMADRLDHLLANISEVESVPRASKRPYSSDQQASDDVAGSLPPRSESTTINIAAVYPHHGPSQPDFQTMLSDLPGDVSYFQVPRVPDPSFGMLATQTAPAAFGASEGQLWDHELMALWTQSAAHFAPLNIGIGGDPLAGIEAWGYDV